MTLTTVLTPQNQTAYDSLYVSLLDGLGTLQLLIAVCENDALRYEMIERYEQALKPEAQVWRVTLDPIEPSLRQALYELTEQQTLTDYSAQIVTVLGAEKLDSEALKKFWGYLQWTREGLRAFPWPIVLWVPQRLLKEMMKKAPDFWRWRGGIFLFTLQIPSELSPTELMSSAEFSSSSSSLFSVVQLEDSLEKAIQQWGEDSPKLASLYGQLGKVYRQQIEQGHYTTFGQEASRAEQLLQKAINQSSQPSDFLAENLNNLAGLYRSQGKYSEAEPLIARSLAIKEKQLGEDHPSVATGLNNLADLYESQGKYEEAEPLYRRSLAIMEKQLGENHPDVATSLNNLAGLYDSQGKYAEAEPLYLRSLAIREKQLGEDHPSVAISLNNLAGLYKSQGKYEEAEPLFRRALAIWEKQLGKNHPLVASSLNNLALLYKTQGKYAEAELLYRRSLSILESQLGENHPDVAISLNNLAGLYQSQGKYAETEPLYLRSLSIRESQLGENHPDVATSLNNLAALYESQGKYAEAEHLYQRAIAILLATLGENHPNTQKVKMNYYQMLAQLSDDELNQHFPPEMVAMIQSLR
ncbi:MAG: tetratricopeptide repeat protein [Snowella sp.]|nr:MAG: tetratricopeptide repeat protein [Snowella sp.]